MKILVLETDGQNASVLCGDGAFRTMPAQPGWECGMELFIESPENADSPIKEKKKAKIFSLPGIIKTAASVAACLALAFGIYSFYTNLNAVNSYVEVGINPAVRLEVNKSGKVISVAGINSDGEQLAAKLSDSGKVNAYVSDVINQAIADGYFENGSRPVSIVVANDNASNAEAMEKELLEAAAKTLEGHSIQPIVHTRRTTLAEADAVHKSVKSSVEMGVPLNKAYELSQWGSTSSSLWIEEIEYKRDGIINIDFSCDFLPDGNEKIELVSQSGERIPAKRLASSEDSWRAQAANLTEGEIYRIEISAMYGGKSVALSGVFLASKYIQTSFELETVTTDNTFLFPGGIQISDDAFDNYTLTENTAIVIKTQSGESFSAEKFEQQHEAFLIYTDKIALGDIFTAEISGITDRRGRPCSLRAVCRATSEKIPTFRYMR